jgi:hypothetical protein
MPKKTKTPTSPKAKRARGALSESALDWIGEPASKPEPKSGGDDNIILGKRPGEVVRDTEPRKKISLGRGKGRPINPNSKLQLEKKARLEKAAAGLCVGGKGKKGKKGEIVGNMPALTLTSEVHKQIVEAVGRGNWRSVAYQMAGVQQATFHQWMMRGEKHLQEIVEGTRLEMTRQAHLVLDLAKAEGKVHDFHNQQILREAKPELRFTWLTKRFAKEWADPGISKDDKTGEETKIDLVSALLDRLKPLQASGPITGDDE